MKLIKKLKSLSDKDQVKTAIFSAGLVLPVYESYFPDDLRVRNAIRAADVADAIRAAYAAYVNAAYAAYAAAYADDAAYAADAVRHSVKAGAKKRMVYEFMARLSAS